MVVVAAIAIEEQMKNQEGQEDLVKPADFATIEPTESMFAKLEGQHWH